MKCVQVLNARPAIWIWESKVLKIRSSFMCSWESHWPQNLTWTDNTVYAGMVHSHLMGIFIFLPQKYHRVMGPNTTPDAAARSIFLNPKEF